MEFLSAFFGEMWDTILAILQSPFGPWLEALAFATAAVFFVTGEFRAAVDEALSSRDRGKPLGFFDLSVGDTDAAIKQKRPVVPERLWTYDENYLALFKTQAASVDIGKGTALDVYLKTVLRFDMLFAACRALFVAVFWWAVATADWAPLWLARLAHLFASMGILYGVADICEDRKLITTLRAKKIDPAHAAAANLLTRIKLGAIVLSIVGFLMFGVLSAVGRAADWLWGAVSNLVAAARQRLGQPEVQTIPPGTVGHA